MDLHLHTPASSDYQEPHISYLDILRKAELRGLDIIAFTDHNSVAGYAAMMREIDRLTYLQKLGRAQADEVRLLNEYHRLLDKILVLPGFEFTATFGFHILGLFSPATPLRQIEHLLLNLNVPPAVLDQGTSEVGASSDVLTAYQMIDEAGGICLAAHANSTHGVAMKGFDFGGQTRIAYTQDRHLHALEVTDLGRKTRDSTERFFNGTKPGYSRRMRCVQGSDAHRLNGIADKNGKITQHGVGDRVTEVALPERTFEALLEMFRANDFSRTRPFSKTLQPVDDVQLAREEGVTLVQAFHESLTKHGGRLYAVIADVCAFANTNGGTIYIGLSADPKAPPLGVNNPAETLDQLQAEIGKILTPHLEVEIDIRETQGKPVLRLQVPSGAERPYALADNKIYVRDEAETSLAVRDEIVTLVKQGLALQERNSPPPPPAPVVSAPPPEPKPTAQSAESSSIHPPTAGVEIIGTAQNGRYTMHDLRNGTLVNNVTRSSARHLWHYAIKQHEGSPARADKIHWQGEIGLVQRYERSGEIRYDLAQQAGDHLRVYYGVPEAGMQGAWSVFLAPEEETP